MPLHVFANADTSQRHTWTHAETSPQNTVNGAFRPHTPSVAGCAAGTKGLQHAKEAGKARLGKRSGCAP